MVTHHLGSGGSEPDKGGLEDFQANSLFWFWVCFVLGYLALLCGLRGQRFSVRVTRCGRALTLPAFDGGGAGRRARAVFKVTPGFGGQAQMMAQNAETLKE